MNQELIPLQRVGGHVDINEHRTFPLEVDAVAFFQIMKIRLMDINNWLKICKSASSKFYIVDSYDHIISGEPKEGLFIKIDIPGPATKMGDGFDWVQIKNISFIQEHNYEALYMVVHPVPNPLSGGKEASHFYTAESSSTFMISRTASTVKAEIHGRNEVVNSKTKVISDNLRNRLVGMGAKIGLSFPQWKNLAKGLIRD